MVAWICLEPAPSVADLVGSTPLDPIAFVDSFVWRSVLNDGGSGGLMNHVNHEKCGFLIT